MWSLDALFYRLGPARLGRFFFFCLFAFAFFNFLPPVLFFVLCLRCVLPTPPWALLSCLSCFFFFLVLFLLPIQWVSCALAWALVCCLTFFLHGISRYNHFSSLAHDDQASKMTWWHHMMTNMVSVCFFFFYLSLLSYCFAFVLVSSSEYPQASSSLSSSSSI